MHQAAYSSIDSRHGLSSVNKTLEELRSLELIPFNAVQDADIGAVMAEHIVFPQIDSTGLPATLSQPVLTSVLRCAGRFSCIARPGPV
ncbi:glycoside hydrolase family 3 N-terminal domain-containing protein [Anaerotruncus colihominis]|uniref:glycoside hydrolase family 3 N-terminal domain-containing protein n=1 Tax=Anaerotruncus colihominis TaxID=169435 RepID=UPI003B835D0E